MLSQLPPAAFPHIHPGYQAEMTPTRKRKVSDVDLQNSASSAANAPRRRITRACDQCNQLRTKCDGKQPCAHCVEIRITCEYARAYKKRGRIPKDEVPNGGSNNSADAGAHETSQERRPGVVQRPSYSESESNRDDDEPRVLPTAASDPQPAFAHQTNPAASQPARMGSYSQPNNTVSVSNISDFLNPVPSNAYYNSSAFPGIEPPRMHDVTGLQSGTGAMSNIGLGSFPQEFGFPLGDDYSVAFMGKAPMVESPDWLSLASPAFMGMGAPTIPLQGNFEEPLRNPVLQPLIPHITSILPISLACDLLDQYFASTTSAYLRPSSPYILGCVFRKKSFLHPSNPRKCTPALLSSMLWISAQTSDAAFLNTQPDSRSRICQRLLELTIGLLKPLVHSAASAPASDHVSKQSSDEASIGALVGGQLNPDNTQVDNIATYIHLATVVSASERKAASLRWWNAAWSLAREIRLGRELPANPPDKDSAIREEDQSPDRHGSNPHRRAASMSQAHVKSFVPEEEREERRRVWWLLYMMDRHLALCYNRPMFFLNKECEALLQPMNDVDWQAGNFDSASLPKRRRGLNVDCVAHSVFGYFLPLMVILGEILDLNHARNRPRFGPSIKRVKNFENETREIVELLEAYEQSLQEFSKSAASTFDHGNDAVTPSVMSGATNESYAAAPGVSSTEATHQTQTVVSYGTHIMHVLHILLTGKWDPIALLDDNDLWISSQSFVTATGHAVNAADAVGSIIELDPDLSFMPFFIGVYLLQGSFLLLLFADKLQGTVSPEVVRACETIVRAHEACVATLDTQYQVCELFPDLRFFPPSPLEVRLLTVRTREISAK